MNSTYRQRLGGVADMLDQLIEATLNLLWLHMDTRITLELCLAHDAALRQLQQLLREEMCGFEANDDKAYRMAPAILAAVTACVVGLSRSIHYKQCRAPVHMRVDECARFHIYA